MRKIVGSVDGVTVEEVALRSQTGVSVAILTYGALIRDWRVSVHGAIRSVVLGFDEFAPYLTHSPYFGAICGRVANRIGKARFDLDGITYVLPANEGPNHLHGGPRGTARQVWRIAGHGTDSVTLALTSPDQDMGYPGQLDIAVTYTLSDYRLEIDIAAQSDRATPVNIVQHNYFNLAGSGDVLDHRLQLMAGAYTELGEGQIPTGAILPVKGTELDFRDARSLRIADGTPLELDHNFCLNTRRNPAAPAAIVHSPDGALALRLYTDQPGLQVYNSGTLSVPVPGIGGSRYSRFAGLCLEDQNYPDAINHAHFPSSVITPTTPYQHKCAIEIAPTREESRIAEA